jgi:indolepyruvate ferredoxin oxidoreductase alpha subunit
MLDKLKIEAKEKVLLGDEALALGALDAGISAAYGYPGTPSTEILEYLIDAAETRENFQAHWCANEKTAYEAALGASMAGRRSLVTMKHVGLNVASDPFMNSAVVDIHGGLVLAVADDPGMHSSQNEQDSRYFADFAHIPCLEPSNQQEAYEMARDAFEMSERFRMPVMIRVVTRLCHSRAGVYSRRPAEQPDFGRAPKDHEWILLPARARRLWRKVLEEQQAMQAFTEESSYNRLQLNNKKAALGVITTGIAQNYFFENLAELDEPYHHLHIGAYPMPRELIRELAAGVERVLVLEDGYPFVERHLRGILDTPVEVRGRMSGHLPPDGELNPDKVRGALGLRMREGLRPPEVELPIRPPQLCRGCPHGDAYTALKKALESFETPLVTGDIGCYTLGALPPYSAIESTVCMGASIGMAKGAADAGLYPVVAVIGDSTFLHSGITPLLDAVQADADMTVMILDNEFVAMTGAQVTLAPASRLTEIVLGTGVDPKHLKVIDAHPGRSAEMSEIVRKELEHRGLSVIITVRECLEGIRKRKVAQKAAKEG